MKEREGKGIEGKELKEREAGMGRGKCELDRGKTTKSEGKQREESEGMKR